MPSGRTALIASFAALAFITPASVEAQDDEAELTLPGASPWNLDMAEDSCALRRMFGDENQSVFFEMRQFAPGDSFRFMAYSEQLNTGRERDGVRYVLHPDGVPLRGTSPFAITIENNAEGATFGGRLYRTAALAADSEGDTPEVEPDELITAEEKAAREAEISAITLDGAFRQAVRLETGSLAAPMQAMRQCLDNLITFWGIDVEAHRTLSRPVQPVGQQRWVRRMLRTYPSDALQRGEQALLHVRLVVNSEGRVDRCILQSGMGQEVFEEAACGELTRSARFDPALDAEGNAITSFWTTTVAYMLN